MTTSTQPSQWIETLEQISQELEQTVQKLEGLGEVQDEPSPVQTSFEDQLGDTQNRLSQIFECVTKAGEQVQEAETLLKEEEVSLSKWIENAKELYQQLTADRA